MRIWLLRFAHGSCNFMRASTFTIAKDRIGAVRDAIVIAIVIIIEKRIKSTVYRVLQQMRVEGHVNPRPIPDRPRCTSAEDDELLRNLMQANGFRSAQQTVVEHNLNCSAKIVRRRWREQGYHHRIPAQKQALTENHQDQRMAFAFEHLAWENEWENTILCNT
ncbi:uncharacterized protein LOC112455556, partial [Temnothorax curvispinosus]|uniref:Uncharacterized protein LOC112455556 n=1 Tax=Temnothorax curvispinosus TaxID=300111 RepID=A0A6J1PVH4_9HYME